jgi:PEP-CTERM motif
MQDLRTLGLAASLSAAAMLAAGSASAVTFHFGQITHNTQDIASQLSVDVEENLSGGVQFTFRNAVGVASSITEIYFDDGTLFGGIAGISDSDGNLLGVSFLQGANPPDLPGGKSIDPPFAVTQTFLASSTNPQVSRGVNASNEWVAITFDLLDGKTFADTIAALRAGDNLGRGDSSDGTLRIGLHITGINGTSDSYVTVPEPTGVLLFGIGTLIAGAAIRRRS